MYARKNRVPAGSLRGVCWKTLRMCNKEQAEEFTGSLAVIIDSCNWRWPTSGHTQAAVVGYYGAANGTERQFQEYRLHDKQVKNDTEFM